MLLSFFSALLTATMEGFFRDTITAEPNIFFTTLFLIFVYIYLKFPDKFIIHGFLLALLYLVRANALFIFAGFCIALFMFKKGWKQKLSSPIILTAGFFLGLIPYIIRNLLVTGKPFFSLYKYSLLLMTNSFPLYTIWTIIPDVDPVAYTLAHPGEAIQKSFSFARFLVVDFLSVYKPIFLLFSGIGLMLSHEDARIRFLKIMIIAGFIIQTIMLLPVGPVAYYYIFFFPLIIAIGASSATRILKNKSPWVLFCILAVFLVATVPYWKSTRQFNPFPEIGKQVAALTEKNGFLF